MMSNTTQLPIYNPDTVIISCPLVCQLHNFEQGKEVPTVPRHRKIEGARDSNGYCIYVMSGRTNEPVWLSDIEYSLPAEVTKKEVADV